MSKLFQNLGGGGGPLGPAPDGEYGFDGKNPSGVAEGDTPEEYVEKLATLFAKITPEPPANLSDKTLTIPGQYSALEATTGTLHPVVTNDTTPIVTPGQTQTLANSFSDADTGTLSAEVDAVEVGSRVLTTGSDVGTYGELQILFDFDPYAGIPFQENIFTGLVARINSATLSIGQHIAALIHTITGTASLTFWVDDPVAPSSTNRDLTSSGSSSFRSGVPGIAAGQTVLVEFDAVNCVKTHYNSTRIGRATSSQTNAVNAALPGTPPDADDVVPIAINLTVASNAYTENLSVNCIVYNSAGTTATNAVTATNNIRVDTVGDESIRVISGTGQYPSSGYGGAFDSTVSLATASNYELQYLNGVFTDPPAVDYSSRYPVGPNYSSLSYDPHNSMRWATFSLGSISSQVSVSLNIAGATNFGGTALVSGIELYVRVDGATPTTGWIDANAAYPGVGDPTANGDAALVVGSSTATNKVVTFGASVKTGTVYVRIGIPQSSNKTFTGIS